ncbi:hypothetical protein G3I78_40935 [Streptomyces sp. SID13726]|nr:hypothetical protein [Streptomyces sp. SID13726]
MLLSLDEETSVPREAPLRVSLTVSAAALLELGFSGHLTERDGTLVVAGASAPVDPAAAVMAEHLRGHPEQTSREWLPAVRERARHRVPGAAEEGTGEGGGATGPRHVRIGEVPGDGPVGIRGAETTSGNRPRTQPHPWRAHGRVDHPAAPRGPPCREEADRPKHIAGSPHTRTPPARSTSELGAGW